MGKVVIKILQGSAVTQTVLGGLTIYLLVANFLQCTCANNYGNWLAVHKVIAKIIWLTFLAHPVYCKKSHTPHDVCKTTLYSVRRLLCNKPRRKFVQTSYAHCSLTVHWPHFVADS